VEFWIITKYILPITGHALLEATAFYHFKQLKKVVIEISLFHLFLPLARLPFLRLLLYLLLTLQGNSKDVSTVPNFSKGFTC
jgi:hypothetical protein